MAAAKFKLPGEHGGGYQVDHPGSVLFECEAFEDQVIALWLWNINEIVLPRTSFEHVWISSLAYLTFEGLEEVRA